MYVYMYIVMYVYSDVKRLHTHRSFYTEEYLHRGAFAHTHRRLYTQNLSHREAFTQRSFYIQMRLHTQAFTQRSLYTAELLHTDAFTCKRFYMQKLLHTEAFTPRSFCKENPCHSVTLHNGNFTTVLPEMLRPRTGTTVLCEPAQSKCTWTCHKSIQDRFCVRILRGMPRPRS